MDRQLGEVVELVPGLWQAAVSPGHAQELLACMDPEAQYVVLTCGDGGSLDWHLAPVSIHDEPPQMRLVKGLSFRVQVSPDDLAAVGPLMHASHDGSLLCVQSTSRPTAFEELPEHPKGRAAVMRRSGAVLAINLPHDGEVAVLWSVGAHYLEDFLARMRKRALSGS